MGAVPTRTPHSPSPAVRIPDAAVQRMATYLGVLRVFSSNGVSVASSGRLAELSGVNAAILRKDLSYVSANGVRGVGYDVAALTEKLAATLGAQTPVTVAVAGDGELGRAVAASAARRGFAVVAVVADAAGIAAVCAGGNVRIGVIANGAGSGVFAEADAQAVCDAFLAAGVTQILNVTGVDVVGRDGARIRPVDLGLEVQKLAFAGVGGTGR